MTKVFSKLYERLYVDLTRNFRNTIRLKIAQFGTWFA